jgi:acetate kinase
MGILTHENEGEDMIKIEMAFADHAVALDKVISLITDSETGKVKDIACIKVVGHRVVHGGEKFSAATVIDEETLNAIKEAAALAPLHNPANITGIEVATKLFNCPQVTIFREHSAIFRNLRQYSGNLR